MRPYTLKIASGAVEKITAVGNYVRIKSAGVPVTIESKDNSESAELEQGDAVTLTAFKEIYLSHGSGSEQTITVYVGNGTRADSARVSGNIAIAPGGTVTQTQKTVVPASLQLIPANPARKFLLIQNKDAVGVIWINMAGAAASQASGVRILPGASILLDVFVSTSEFFAIGDIANTNVVVVEG